MAGFHGLNLSYNKQIYILNTYIPPPLFPSSKTDRPITPNLRFSILQNFKKSVIRRRPVLYLSRATKLLYDDGNVGNYDYD
jgi:hypothetical protein